MTKSLSSLYRGIPSCPGVYLMRNSEGMIIYIGKAINLKSRVTSYFMPGATLNFAKKKMVKLIKKIDFIETKNDIEALMLETNMIKKNQPKYNVLMKDGKNLSYIKITNDEIPCIVRTRIKTKSGEYFGPYSQYFDAYSYARFIRKIFKLGNHERIDKFGPPCMDTYIGLCPGHCTGDPEKIQIYLERVKQARDFLMGNQEKVIEEMKLKMTVAAGKREYEEAAEYKNIIAQIEGAGSTQIVRDAITGDATVIVMLEKYDHIFLSFVEVKNSMIVGVHEYKLANPLEETAEFLISQAVIQYIAREETRVVYTDLDIEKMPDLFEYANVRKIKILHPSRGEKVRILEFAHTNLLNFAYRETMEGLKNATLSKGTMISLLERLQVESGKKNVESGGLLSDQYPSTFTFLPSTIANQKEIVFECFDISHSHGEHTVASKSVLVNGKPDPRRYRKYRIKTLKTGIIDDFASMDEILTRRTLGALRKEDPWPDLIVIDGGKGQLSHAVEAIQKIVKSIRDKEEIDPSLSLATPPVISLAKRIEEVFLPNQSEPILLEKGSPELMILQKIRDEAHRFAINYNRSSREKSYTKTILDEIPGIGPVARKKILKSVSKVEELSSWTYQKARDSFGKTTAEALQDHGLIGN